MSTWSCSVATTTSSEGEPSRGQTGLHSRSSDLTSKLQSSVRYAHRDRRRDEGARHLQNPSLEHEAPQSDNPSHREFESDGEEEKHHAELRQ